MTEVAESVQGQRSAAANKKKTRAELMRRRDGIKRIDAKIEKRISKGILLSTAKDGRNLIWFNLRQSEVVLGWTHKQMRYAFEQLNLLPCIVGEHGSQHLSNDQLKWLLLFQRLFRNRPIKGIGKQLRAKYRWNRMSWAWTKFRFRPFPARLDERVRVVMKSRISPDQLRWLFPNGIELQHADKLSRTDKMTASVLEQVLQ